MPVIPTDHIPLHDSGINLDISGVAGFFGGDVAVSAMGTVSLYKGRKWFGWYNSPGSYEIAKRYGRLAQHRFWCGLYPGVTDNPAVLFGLDGKVGPQYRAVHSGTSMNQTGHLAYLLCQECKKTPAREWDKQIGSTRRTSPIDVTIAYLPYDPPEKLNPGAIEASVTTQLSFLPILSSAAACLSCGFVADWYCCAMIAFGMFCSGASCYVIGSGEFTFTHPKPAGGAPSGDGILANDVNDQIVILRGAEGAVNAITRGRFSLDYKSHPSYHNIGWSSVLLTVQFLLQLLVVPQGTIFGQVMFLSSLAASWVYNSFLSSLDKENIQRRILFKTVLEGPVTYKYQLGTRTTMVVFVLLVLSSSQRMDQQGLRKVLDHLIPNDTRVWRFFKETIVREIELLSIERKEPAFQLPSYETLTGAEKELSENLYLDAQTAYRAFQVYKIDRAEEEKEREKDGHSPEELEDQDRVDLYADEEIESNAGTSQTCNNSPGVSVVELDSDWHGSCNPTETNWHGGY
ncbi:hypothetical protein K466DRAFT_594653 [Polyporus arcularius HHB13444]|uniref:Uncharacterized protein n=1 Tax=Polyporus arcularius HHB13444 TaxID=1314778 RepID=A0A5C3PWN7_9APHY|nr:hypothetical protein K466DRAFT_594653 [Polyporus arcularius HHB13444]